MLGWNLGWVMFFRDPPLCRGAGGRLGQREKAGGMCPDTTSANAPGSGPLRPDGSLDERPSGIAGPRARQLSAAEADTAGGHGWRALLIMLPSAGLQVLPWRAVWVVQCRRPQAITDLIHKNPFYHRVLASICFFLWACKGLNKSLSAVTTLRIGAFGDVFCLFGFGFLATPRGHVGS